MIALGCDHGGFALKQEIITHLKSRKLEFIDYGTNDENATDYPVYAKQVSKAILDNVCETGILICGTGIGISIAANRHKGIRCALCTDEFTAKATRLHNNANILALGGRVVGVGLALSIVDAFLDTSFSNDERHVNRVKMIEM